MCPIYSGLRALLLILGPAALAYSFYGYHSRRYPHHHQSSCEYLDFPDHSKKVLWRYDDIIAKHLEEFPKLFEEVENLHRQQVVDQEVKSLSHAVSVTFGWVLDVVSLMISKGYPFHKAILTNSGEMTSYGIADTVERVIRLRPDGNLHNEDCFGGLVPDTFGDFLRHLEVVGNCGEEINLEELSIVFKARLGCLLRFADTEMDVAGLEWKFEQFVSALEFKQAYINELTRDNFRKDSGTRFRRRAKILRNV